MLEDDAIRHAGAVAAQRVRRRDERAGRHQGGELLPNRVQQRYWQGGHGVLQQAQSGHTSMLAGPVSAYYLARRSP